MKTLRNLCAGLLLLIPTLAWGQLPQYGFVVGTLEPSKSFLEKLDEPDKGKFLHYHVFLKTDSNEEYEVVIDVNDVSPTKPLAYRVASLTSQAPSELAQNFGPVFSASSGFHLISNTEASFGPILTPNDAQKKASGALDYIRHPGILKAIRNLPWQAMLAQKTSDSLQWALPTFDAIFKGRSRNGFTKLYVFGGPFTQGKGMHVVHQNQADTGTTFSGTNGIWQDGAIIVERHTNPAASFPLRVSRRVVMVKFQNQTDFSAEANDLTHPAQPGHTLAPANQLMPLGLICGDYQDFGPFPATQLEVATQGASAVPYGPNSAPKIEVHIKSSPFTNLNDPGDVTLLDNSIDPTAKARVFARVYHPLLALGGINARSNFFVRVHAIDPGSYCDSEVGATLRVSRY